MDRGLTAGEQDEYLGWLTASRSHREAMRRLLRCWTMLDGVRGRGIASGFPWRR
jgi:hypothetical protein